MSKSRTCSTGLRGLTNLEVIADLKTGMVKSFEPITYEERLRKVLDALHASRENLRESELRPSFFPDTVGRLEIIHHFRYAMVPPATPGAPSRLSLNVTFDGGWEPYMRVIYRDIGPMLDLLFCHSDSYPGSSSSYEKYCDWVRANEVKGGLFYADSALTLSDGAYLSAFERAQRQGNASDSALARVAVPPLREQFGDAWARAAEDPIGALVLPLRTLKGLYRLSVYFPPEASTPGRPDDMTVLRRFAQSVLADAIVVMRRLDALPPQSAEFALWQNAKAPFRDELDWLDYVGLTPPAKPGPQPCDPADLQSHLLGSANEKVTHGCVVLLRIRKGQEALALKTLQGLEKDSGPLQPGGIAWLVAFTYDGLKQLGVHPGRLDRFPQEFYQGMEARHAILGDLRGNHPDRWTRPPLWGQESGQRVDLGAVHVLVQLRMQVADAKDVDYGLHPLMKAAVDALATNDNGLGVLAVEPLRSYRTGDAVTGHLGVADGISQPVVCTTNDPTTPAAKEKPRYDDRVATGELLLGYPNDRGDAPVDVEDLLRNGSFLVVRKLRQRMDHLAAALRQVPTGRRDEVLGKIVGRGRDGTPLAGPVGASGPNDFNYDTPAASDGCPFHSHIRRANPRDGRAYTPRILRRGMSYGPLPTVVGGAADRGVMFMAYCASIAEQFETIQRWVAGGNSSGVGSAQVDPMLRVPQAGEPHVFRYLDAGGQPVRVDLGDQPLVQLQWGLYLFVPSRKVLANLGNFRAPPDKARKGDAGATSPKAHDALEQMRAELEDRERAPAYWKGVREEPGASRPTPYGELVGKADEVLRILHDDGRLYSVRGYGERMDKSLGLNILGMDATDPARAAQAVVRAALEEISEPVAFATTLAVATEVLKHCPELPRTPDDIVRRPVDLVNYSDTVLGLLCKQWFGIGELRDAKNPSPRHLEIGGRRTDDPNPPRCPGNLVSASKFIFQPHPRAETAAAGVRHGQAVLKAVEDWLADPQHEPGPVARDMLKKLTASGAEATFATNIAGVMLGFAPTVQGNFLTVMNRWIAEDASLWQLQLDLYEQSPQPTLGYDEACKALLAPLLQSMRQEPVPGMLWRERKDGAAVVLGIGSAMADEKHHAPDDLLFGRDAADKKPTTHGCPGMAMGKGVLLGMVGALLKAGTLRPTGSSVLLILTPNR